jgi:hypothetical protein
MSSYLIRPYIPSILSIRNLAYTLYTHPQSRWLCNTDNVCCWKFSRICIDREQVLLDRIYLDEFMYQMQDRMSTNFIRIVGIGKRLVGVEVPEWSWSLEARSRLLVKPSTRASTGIYGAPSRSLLVRLDSWPFDGAFQQISAV